MPDQDSPKEPKDFWDKLDVVAKIVTAVAVSAGIGYYGIWSENKRQALTEENRTSQAKDSAQNQRIQRGIQMLTSREAVVADMRAKMFSDLIQHYLKGDDPASRVVLLEVMALNFQDLFQLRPLFEDLNARLSPASKEKKELRRVARAVTGKQIEKIVASGGFSCEVELKLNEASTVPCAPLEFKLLEVGKDTVVVSPDSEHQVAFEVSDFDMPFSDHSKRGELMYSVVLPSFAKGKTAVTVVVFPRHYYSGEDRLVHDQLFGEYFFEPTINEKKDAASVP